MQKDAAQQRIETLSRLAQPKVVAQLVSCAERGIEAPDSLSPSEIQQLCYAVVVHYALKTEPK